LTGKGDNFYSGGYFDIFCTPRFLTKIDVFLIKVENSKVRVVGYYIAEVKVNVKNLERAIPDWYKKHLGIMSKFKEKFKV
jgi:hypothetical protein